MMMELSCTVWLLLSIILFACLCFHRIILHTKSNKGTSSSAFENQRLPPGRAGWPLLGETWDYFSSLQGGALDKFVMERRNKYSSKIFRTSLIGQPVAMLCNAEGNKFLFSNEQKLVHLWLPSSMDKIFPKSDNETSTEHSKKLRKVLPSILKANVLQEYVGVMDALMKKHLEIDWNSKEVKVVEMAKRYVFTLGCNSFLGINDPGKIDELSKGAEDIATGIHSLPINLPGTALNRAVEASKLMRKEVETMVRQRKAELLVHNSTPAKDFMSHMILATDDDGQYFNETDIASHLVGLVLAGYTTLHSTITILLKYLAELPDVYDSVLREQREILNLKDANDAISWEDIRRMKYTWNAACEVLRLMPPAIGGFREALTDFTYAGYTIPRGWKLHWIGLATHKNPEYFPNPERFDPSRFQGENIAPYTFVPFGGGSRMCPGNEYARVAILVFVHNVVTKFKWEMIIPEEKILHDPVPRPAHGLPVRLYCH